MILGLIIGIVIGYLIFAKATGSDKYRKLLTNLFVAGRIRQLASDKDISISKEYKAFKSFYRKIKIDKQSLDNQIEEELQHDLLDTEDLIEDIEEDKKDKE